MMKDMKISNKNYYLLKEKKVQETNEKVMKMLEKIRAHKSNKALWSKQTNECKRRYQVYKDEQCLKRTWMHVDMDMFYAACEIRDAPELKEKAIAVGDYSMI